MGKKQSVTCCPTTTRAGKTIFAIGDIYLSQDILQGCIVGCGVVGASASSLFKCTLITTLLGKSLVQRGYHVDEDPPLTNSGCYQTQRIAIYAVNYALLALFETGQVFFSL
jgi:hypothetical protein